MLLDIPRSGIYEGRTDEVHGVARDLIGAEMVANSKLPSSDPATLLTGLLELTAQLEEQRCAAIKQLAEVTPRERDVARLLCDDLSSKEIARVLGISHRTVEIYRANLFRKLDVRSGMGVALIYAKATHFGLAPIDDEFEEVVT